jgi:hypothetical protein
MDLALRRFFLSIEGLSGGFRLARFFLTLQKMSDKLGLTIEDPKAKIVFTIDKSNYALDVFE